MRYSALLFFVLLFLLFFSSCKKGCTNASALNYNASAKEDDASCLFCDSVSVFTYTSPQIIIDNNFPSQHYQQAVLRTTPAGNLYQYRGNNCKALGLAVDCNSFFSASTFAHIDFYLVNLVSDTLVVSGQFTISGNSLSEQRLLNNFTIAPNDSVLYPEHFYLECESPFTTPTFYSFTATFQYK